MELKFVIYFYHSYYKKNFKFYDAVRLGDKIIQFGAETRNVKLYINKEIQSIRACKISEKAVNEIGEVTKLASSLLDFQEFNPENKF